MCPGQKEERDKPRGRCTLPGHASSMQASLPPSASPLRCPVIHLSCEIPVYEPVRLWRHGLKGGVEKWKKGGAEDARKSRLCLDSWNEGVRGEKSTRDPSGWRERGLSAWPRGPLPSQRWARNGGCGCSGCWPKQFRNPHIISV